MKCMKHELWIVAYAAFCMAGGWAGAKGSATGLFLSALGILFVVIVGTDCGNDKP
jgi:hypothetical protein